MASRLNQSKTVREARRAEKARRLGHAANRPGRSNRKANGKAKNNGHHEAPTPPRPRVVEAAKSQETTAIGPGSQRVRWVAAAFGLIGIVLVAQAARLQLVEYGRLSAEAERQFRATAMVTAKRGAIRDRNGNELAITVDVDSVFFEWRTNQRRASPEQIRSLATLLKRPVDAMAQKLGSRRRFVYLARRVDASTAARVRALAVPGVRTKREPKRFYSNVQLGAHVLGFTNVDGEGKAGIERRFDDQLKGRRQAITGLRDAFGTPIFSEGAVPQAALRGADVELTIDRHIQYAAEQALGAAVAQHRAKAGVAIVMEPATGDVLALASYPDFNPNNLRDTTVSQRTNRAVNAVFEPGSTLKMVTVAAALEQGLIRPTTVLDCEDGRWSIGANEIRDANHRYGALTIAEVIQKSSNICAAKIGFKLGRRRLYEALQDFGFGARTGLELPGELKGLIRPAARWSDIGLANIAFGQGVSATPVQIIQAAATIANGGVRVSPRLVRAVRAPRGRRVVLERPERVRVISRKTARTIGRMMATVTQEGGTAEEAAIPGFRVAGKTGTAQKIDPVTRAYSHELFVSSFVGFVPADAPELVALLLIDEPQGAVYGGDVAGPAWRKMTVSALAARGVRPRDPLAFQAFRSAGLALASLPPPAAVAEAVHGEAALSAQDTPLPSDAGPNLADAFDLALSKKAQRLLGLDYAVAAVTGDVLGPTADHRMPNFARLTLREVLNRAADTRCDLVVDGTGRVVEQRPRAGMPLAPNTRCELTLAPRR